ncbi:MAG: hypothetical protein ABW136_09635 [Steroidobacteraceae bacterium]
MAGALIVAFPAWTATAALDEAVMENMEIVNESLGSNLGLRDAAAATADARDLASLLDEARAYFVERGDAEEGVRLATESKAITGRIIDALEAGRFEPASELAAELSRQCKVCHRQYKPE